MTPRKMSKREKVLIICLEQTQMMLVQCLNDPTSAQVHKSLQIQFELNKRIITNIQEEEKS